MNVKTVARFWHKKTILLLVCAMLVLVAIPSVSAFTAEFINRPDLNLYNGDSVQIRVTGLAASDIFQLNMSSPDLKTNGGAFTITNFNMPFSMKPANTTLLATNLDATGLKLHVQNDGTTTQDWSTTTAPYMINARNDVNKITYKDITITGYPATAGQAITMDFSQNGTVVDAGTSPSTLSFVASNLNSGSLRIVIKDNGVEVMNQTLTVKGTIRPAPTSSGGDSGGSSGSGTTTVSKSAVVAAPVVAAAPVGQVTTPLQTNPQGQTLQPYNIETTAAAPVDATVSIPQGTKSLTSASAPLSSVTVTPLTATEVTAVTAGTAPAGGVFAVEGAAVECSPAGATFNQPVTISFTLTEAQYTAALAKAGFNPNNIIIQYFNPTTQAWTGITMNAPNGRTISGTTTHFTVFQVFSTSGAAPVSTSSQTYGSLIQETPTTVSLPSVQATQVAKASPTTTPKSPFVPSIAVLAIVGLVGYFVVSRKH